MQESPVADYASCTPADRLVAIQQLGALLSATTAELLEVIAVSDAADDHRMDGALTMKDWLVAGLRVSYATARDLVAAAGRVDELPALHEAFASGQLSWDQARPAMTFANAGTDEALARELPGCTVAQIEVMARAHRPRSNQHARDAVLHRRLGWRKDHEAGGYRYSGFLPADTGELVNQALTRAADQIGPDPLTELWDPFERRVADALVDMATQQVANDADPDACLVVVHADAPVIDGDVPGNGTINEIPIPAETVRRLLCDTKIEFSIDGPDGTTIGIGRTSRTPPRWLRRRIARRDGTCRFPGCGRPIRHRHHLQHWTRGGPTDANNLIGVCWYHHHLVHEGGWIITGNADHELTFTSPYGRTLTSRPPPVDPEVHRRARCAAGVEDLASSVAGTP